uniref:glutathione peroxidase n=1 Tax=Oncorhynchus mykiss TaxID=8022 RepID=A0A8K9WYK6_ONCMY
MNKPPCLNMHNPFKCVCVCVDPQVCDPSKDGTIYNYKAKTLNGSRSVSLSEYMGKTVLFVNYLGKTLNALHEEMKDYGFTILGFPSNQFGKQEPGENHEILATLKHVRPGNGFVPNFLLFQRGDVNGDTEQGVYTFLKLTDCCHPSVQLFWEPLKINDIKWNFEKFLVGPDGKPVMRWFPRVPVSEVREDILKYILRRTKTFRICLY